MIMETCKGIGPTTVAKRSPTENPDPQNFGSKGEEHYKVSV